MTILVAMDLQAFPGGDLIETGLQDLAANRCSVESLLVAIGAPRLRTLGLTVSEHHIHFPEHRLYELLAQSDSDSAHSRYNALIRLLVSFEQAMECAN